MPQPSPDEIALPGDGPTIHPAEAAILSQELREKDREIERLKREVFQQRKLHREYKARNEASQHRAEKWEARATRFEKLALWSAREGGNRCDACMVEAAKLWEADFDEPSRIQTEEALVEDMLQTLDDEKIEEYCEHGNCGDPAHLGGWVAYVPEGETAGVRS